MTTQLKAVDPNVADIIKKHAAMTMPRSGGTHLSLLPSVYPKGHTFSLVDDKLHVPEEAAIVFVDHEPGANWGHPCSYRFYDPATGDLLREEDALFPPNLAGDIELDLFHAPMAHAIPPRPRVMPQNLVRQVQLVPTVDQQRYAILWTSQITNVRHVEDLEFLWRTLINRYGFNPSNIYVLCYNGTIGATDAGAGGIGNWYGDNTAYQMKVHASATAANLQAVFTELKGKLRPRDMLFVHTNNHGSPTGLCIDNSSVVTPASFGTMLSGLPKYSTLVVTMEQCYSGAFQSDVTSKSTAGNTVFASAVPANKTSAGAAHFDPWALDLIEALTGLTPAGAGLSSNPSANLDGVPSLKSACDWAKATDTGVGDDPQYAEQPAGCGTRVSLSLNPPMPARVGDVDGDGAAELLITSPWGLGVLERSGSSLNAPVMAANGTRIGDWLLNTADNQFGPIADYDGDGHAEILVTSLWGIGLLKVSGSSMSIVTMAANGTRFGGWLLDTTCNSFGPAADYDGDGRAELLVKSPWGIGILKLSGNSWTCPMLQPNGTRFGGWLLNTVDNEFGSAADYNKDGHAELLVKSPWGIGLLALSGNTMTAPMMQPNGTRFGGWLLNTADNNFGRVADYDGDGRAELLVSSPWGIGLLKMSGSTMTAPMMQPNGTRFGGWLLNTPDNKFGPVADYDGDGKAEVLISSGWGIGILKLSGSTMTAPMMAANGTRFGGWLLNTADNRFALAGKYDGGAQAELLVTSPWGLGILRQSGTTMAAPVMAANGTRFGGWLLNTADNQF